MGGIVRTRDAGKVRGAHLRLRVKERAPRDRSRGDRDRDRGESSTTRTYALSKRLLNSVSATIAR
jgi:hypothetical protein